MATITIEVPEERLKSLREEAARRGVTIEELARQGLDQMLQREAVEFGQAMNYVLDKNAELYRRLAR